MSGSWNDEIQMTKNRKLLTHSLVLARPRLLVSPQHKAGRRSDNQQSYRQKPQGYSTLLRISGLGRRRQTVCVVVAAVVTFTMLSLLGDTLARFVPRLQSLLTVVVLSGDRPHA
jgi:hypothetical protein